MRRITSRDKALRVEHQALIRARFDGLDTGGDTIDFGMRVQPRVLHIGAPSAHRHRVKRERLFRRLRVSLFKFRRYNNGGVGDHHARVLIGRRAQTARDHKADMHILLHFIGRKRFIKPRAHIVLADPDIKVQRRRAFPETIQMIAQKSNPALMHPQPLPNPVPEHKAGIKDIDHSLIASHQRAIDVKQNGFIARIGNISMRAIRHGLSLSS